MPPSAMAMRRTQNGLLLQKLLNLRDGASPFTLVLDTVEQSARPVVDEFMLRAKLSSRKVVFVSLRTSRSPSTADVFLRAHHKSSQDLQQELHDICLPTHSTVSETSPKFLVVFDNLNVAVSKFSEDWAALLSSLLSPSTSIVGTYHVDMPLSVQPAPYAPSPLSVLSYLATAILKVFNFSHVIESKSARDKSLPEPEYGLAEHRNGVVVGLRKAAASAGDLVLEMELRRKSGRGVKETFVVTSSSSTSTQSRPAIGHDQLGNKRLSKISLLEDHPLYVPQVVMHDENHAELDKEAETTFSLGLTAKQRQDREGVVLPYFDAQNDTGVGDGGRILYEMGREDDFDDDEDDEL